ncbi:hypothetical protein WA026_003383 [Henosepilachna vigintioctopunctata]|uniref:Farnesol dehydrogenase n=1 Tax=Henosepilachna vigintioctopunctata TaxID=420089 RepID=A0AAW1TLZ4_9CUCU
MVLNMERWKGKVAVVTGASAGIGAAIVEQLVQEGLIVIGLARRIERIEDISKNLSSSKGSLHGFKVDLRNTEDIISTFTAIENKFGPIHVLINNAGIVHNTTLMDGDIEKWKNVIDVNVMGLCVATREAINSMRRNEVAGHIVHINSDLGHVIPSIPGLNVYPASKFAVSALTEVLRGELMRSGTKIKVTSVSPGLVGNTEIFCAAGGIDSGIDKAPALHPEDVAEAVIYVLSTPPHVQVHDVILKPLGSGH